MFQPRHYKKTVTERQKEEQTESNMEAAQCLKTKYFMRNCNILQVFVVHVMFMVDIHFKSDFTKDHSLCNILFKSNSILNPINEQVK